MTERLAILREQLRDAADFLSRVLQTEPSEVQRTAAIKGFEFCVELSWRTMKAALTDTGIESISPKDTIRKAGQAVIIEDVERWLAYIDLRNLTSHTYTEKVAAEVYASIDPGLVKDIRGLLDSTDR